MSPINLPENKGLIFLDQGPVDWYSRAARSIKLRRKGLEEIGVDNETIEHINTKFNDLKRRRPKSLKGILLKRAIEAKIDIRTNSSKTNWYKLKIFALHLPKNQDNKKIPGSKVIYCEEPHLQGYGNWTINVGGIGTGNFQKVRYVWNMKAEATDGKCLCLYVKVPFKITKTTVYRKLPWSRLGEGYIAEVDPECSGRQFSSKPICLGIECEKAVNGPALALFPQPIDSPQSPRPTIFNAWYYKTPKEMEARISISQNPYKVNITIFRRIRLTVEFKLPAGNNYTLHSVSKYPGLRWATEPIAPPQGAGIRKPVVKQYQGPLAT